MCLAKVATKSFGTPNAKPSKILPVFTLIFVLPCLLSRLTLVAASIVLISLTNLSHY
jgi:hypothetical protein